MIPVQLGDPEGGSQSLQAKVLPSLKRTHYYLHCLLGDLKRGLTSSPAGRWVLGLQGANQRHFQDNDPPGRAFFPQAKQTLTVALPIASEHARLVCVQPQRVPPGSRSNPRTNISKQTRCQPRTNTSPVSLSPVPSRGLKLAV